MGQSADGAEVRLLQVVDERPTVIGAPIDEVRLLDADVTLEELPILIADETVVFPGDDFRVGQGKILPKANEWMWLPWGWLLAHNDTHIWQWRPETDELEFIERPPGYAKLSPDGRYLAIADLCPLYWVECPATNNVLLVPLDGSRPISLVEQLSLQGRTPGLYWDGHELLGNMVWSPNGAAVKLYVFVAWDGTFSGQYPVGLVSLVFHADGQVVTFEEWAPFQVGDMSCQTIRWIDDYGDHWFIRDDSVITVDVTCQDEDGEGSGGWLMYTLSGEFLRFDDVGPWRDRDHGAEVIRAAPGGSVLSDHLSTSWSQNDRYAFVVDREAANAWVYDSERHELTSVKLASAQGSSLPLWKPPERTDDLVHFYVHATWNRDQVGATIARLYGVRATILVDAATAIGTILDLGGYHSYPLSGGAQGWHPQGNLFQIASSPFEARDGLAMPDYSGIYEMLTVDEAGALANALMIASTCGESVVSDRWRNRVDWSRDGSWFAVGGQQLDGLFSCPD
ncbi:MAG: hypothetical protein F4Z51_05275 [Chloroflexi bacterium]|nr:hypothetical protein [Chloroflexota bacterium]